MSATVTDLAHAKLVRRIEGLTDVELLEYMLGMLGTHEGLDAPMLGGVNQRCATVTRTLFSEIAQRWIPLEPFAAAFAAVQAGLDLEEDGGDA